MLMKRTVNLIFTVLVLSLSLFSVSSAQDTSSTSTISSESENQATTHEAENTGTNYSQSSSGSDTLQQLEDLEVKAKKDKVTSPIKQSKEISKIELQPEQIQKLTTVGESDISRTLQLLPGVSAANENSAGLFIRGSTPDQNLIILDDFMIPSADHLFGFNSAFNANSIGGVALYKGGFPVKYGGRTSGVLELLGKEGNKERFSAGGEVGFISAIGFVEIPLFSKGALHIGGRTSYSDLLQSDIFTSVIKSLNPNINNPMYNEMKSRFANLKHDYPYNFYDLNSTAFYQATENDHVKYSLFTSEDKFKDFYRGDTTFSMPGPNPDTSKKFKVSEQVQDNSKWKNFGNSLSWAKIWSESWNSKIGIGYSDYKDDKDNGSNMRVDSSTVSNTTPLFAMKFNNRKINELNTLNGKIDNDFILNEMNRINVGTEAIASISKYTVSRSFTVPMNQDTTIERREEIQDTSVQGAFYLNDEISLYEKFKLTPGLRSTYYTGTHKLYLEPRVHGSVTLLSSESSNESLTLSAAWGKYNQYINKVLHEDFFAGESYFWFNADDKHCNVIKAQHIIGSISYSTPSYHVGMEAYRIDRKGLAHYTSSSQSADDLDSPLFYDGTSITDGVELMFQKKVGLYSGWISYTWNKTIDEFPDLYEGKPFPDQQDRTHALTLVNTLSQWGFDLSAIWIYSTGLPYTKLLSIFSIQNAQGQSNQFFNIVRKNGYRLKDYHRLDLNLMYTFTNTNRYKAQVGFAVFNVYDRVNEWSKSYIRTQVPQVTPGPGRTRIQERTKTFWGRTPSLFIKVNF